MAVFKRWRSCQFAGRDWVLHAMAYLVLKSKNEVLFSWGGWMDGWSAPHCQSERLPPSTCRSWLYKSPRTAAREQSPYSSPASFLSTTYDAVRPPARKKNLDHFLQAYMGQFPQDRENGQNVALFIFLELCCDQTIWFFQLFWTVQKRFCPLDSKKIVLVLAHLEPELELFEVWVEVDANGDDDDLSHVYLPNFK